MAHLPPNAAIFSPSVARAAASAAKDWNFVDSWLAARFRGRAPPPFERNPDTLRALLALVALNEPADEERDLLARAEACALRDAEAWDAARDRDRDRDRDVETDPSAPSSAANLLDDVLDAIEDSLSRDGRSALDALASTAVELGIAYPDAPSLASSLSRLQSQTLELDRAAGRVASLRRHVDASTTRAHALASELRGEAYRSPADLARNNLDVQRALKAAAARLPELEDRVASLAAAVGGGPSPTVEQVRREEVEYLDLLALRNELDARVRSFRGLPPDTDAARRELESLRDELARITQRRDAVFEGLVERETPRKPTR
ncbi:hypothetical protein QBC33DRAFT_588499 [Phialemonium atrogriseum]|uniref:HAUS augmin-like complex subunit 1 n=1 Tax=Phialemonium atrogriseum TaxID=1093897 RepID=A0AAJ0FKH8_9PEZI|nr:uncharacterized protein QBC33DRAFT_588499 [Phialemonium atrogriseum]KAK1766408.1 hypothetical protein QBC33DRAFT_588499 [Phialemonium atrogriseum]